MLIGERRQFYFRQMNLRKAQHRLRSEAPHFSGHLNRIRIELFTKLS